MRERERERERENEKVLEKVINWSIQKAVTWYKKETVGKGKGKRMTVQQVIKVT